VSKSRTVGAVLALAALTLTGCGAIQPGTAVEVGDESVSVARVDEISTDFCSAIQGQLETQAETIPNSYLRGGIAGTLALRSVADQLADEFGVTADGEQYLQTLADIQQGVAAVPEDLRESVIEVESAPAYVEAVQAAVGEAVLEGDGEYGDFVAAGTEEFEAWIAENGVEFDPSLNTVIADGTVTTADQSLSFAVSERARAGLAEQPNSVTARQLTYSQRCGR
jgi:hypothetical protein